MSNVRPLVTQSKLNTILLAEDDSARSHRQAVPRPQWSQSNANVTVRVHKIVEGEWKTVCDEAEVSHQQPKMGQRQYKQTIAIDLLRNCSRLISDPVVVAGTSYGSSSLFIRSLIEQRLDFVVEIRPSLHIKCGQPHKWTRRKASDTLGDAVWKTVEVARHEDNYSIRYSVDDLGEACLPDDTRARLFAAQTGGIVGLHRGTIIGLTSLRSVPLEDLVRYIGWVRWIRPLIRRQEKDLLTPTIRSDAGAALKHGHDLMLKYRSNITFARLQDSSPESDSDAIRLGIGPRGTEFTEANVLTVVELFAGAGGMGLGFLMAEHPRRRFRLILSGELNPIYTKTLEKTHDWLVEVQRSKWSDFVPASVEPLNLNDRETLELVSSKVIDAGGIDVLVGGPPCQGFSNANRNSWSSTNPHNQMIDVFMKYVEELNPSVFLIENVQGIAWTVRNDNSEFQLSVTGHIVERMERAGYVVFPKLLDAVWYGVPQFRTRLFVVGIHRDAGYCVDDFGDWGPFPTPTHGPLAGRSFVTVRQAIEDLPPIDNGHGADELDYCAPGGHERNGFLDLMRSNAPEGKIVDHTTSRHAEYVIERYKRIPPGGNWQDIREMMSNYSQLERTHSNIYRRLEWDEPSITIGHYRKSMIIHPQQHRGLSLREASRLQSFPDWFRFSGTLDGRSGGLMHQQQQLANAVCPLMSKAIAEFLLEL